MNRTICLPLLSDSAIGFLLNMFLCVGATFAGERSASSVDVFVGTGTINITPDKPVALAGQHHTRIARDVVSPCTATAVALESRRKDKVLDQAIMISCDLISIRKGIIGRFREKLAARLPGFDLEKVFLNGTHTHTAPVMLKYLYDIPDDAMQPEEYIEFLTDQLCDLAVNAWKSRKPGGVSWGLGHAVVACNRRMVYANGTARMYGPTDAGDFRHVEGREDHGVEVLFFWSETKKLIAVAVNVACPSQEVEGGTAVNADFWHDVRLKLRKKYGDDLCVLAWCGAAGDQSPHLLWRNAAEDRMCELRGLTRMEEIARRIVRAVDEAYEVAKLDVRFKNVPLVHVVKNVKLPVRIVTDTEYRQRKVKYDALMEKENPSQGSLFRLKLVMDRYESQKANPFYEMELHVIRLGDVVIATNPFELFTDYGIQMKSRSKAVQTFVIQLAGPGKYVPTAEAVRAGGYSTAVQSNVVGPEGGQVLVERTVEEINQLWHSEDK